MGDCVYERATGTITCSLPHCLGCGSHFNPGAHTHAVLCGECVAWHNLEARMPEAYQEAKRRALAFLGARKEG